MTGKSVLVTGGGGYVGAVLVPELLARGYRVTVLDLFLYGPEPLLSVAGEAGLRIVEGDIRDRGLLESEVPGHDAVIHLACISNDPSFELDPELGKSINLLAFPVLVDIAKDAGVSRFIYASSSSVYGLKEEPEVTEDMSLEPLTDYSRFKAECERMLADRDSGDFTTVTVRPATVCGYSPRQRLDVIVNILTNHAVNTGRIKVFGGSQKRPNIHIRDMVESYFVLLEAPSETVRREVFNVGYENHTVMELATMVRDVVGRDDVELDVVPTDDNRSYHVSSKKIAERLGFTASCTIADAVRDLVAAFSDGLLPDSMTDSRYFNIKRMQEVNLR
jgi:nucleoside-diphosphate-sugar epimerase